MRKELLLGGLLLLLTPFGQCAAAHDFHEPPAVPPALKGTEPHNPRVLGYYLDNFISQGQMTVDEARSTHTYMIYRFYRRRRDLRAVQGMDRERRRAYMRERRAQRGNPLLEYALFTGIPLKRAAALVDLFHYNDMGILQYGRLMKKRK